MNRNICDHEYCNKIKYGIESDAVRYTWAGYFLFILTSSLIGDTAILIASIKYRAFKLHGVIVVIIQHIAVCDLMVSLTDVLSKLVSLLANRWATGTLLCYLSTYAKFYFVPAGTLLICTMTTCKVLLLKFPCRFGMTTVKQAHLICAACWMVTLLNPIAILIADGNDVYFSYRNYQCDHGYSTKNRYWLRPCLAAIFGFLPTCLVVATTAILLIIAKRFANRGRANLKWQGITTILLTAAVYCISVLPLVAGRVAESIVKVEDKSQSFLHMVFYRLALSFIFLNTISNFFIYSLTLPSFRKFIRKRMHLPIPHFSSTTSTSHGN